MTALQSPAQHEFSPMPNGFQCSECFLLKGADCHSSPTENPAGESTKSVLNATIRKVITLREVYDEKKLVEMVTHEIYQYIEQALSLAKEQERERIREAVEREIEEEPVNVEHPYFERFVADWKIKNEVISDILSLITDTKKDI